MCAAVCPEQNSALILRCVVHHCLDTLQVASLACRPQLLSGSATDTLFRSMVVDGLEKRLGLRSYSGVLLNLLDTAIVAVISLQSTRCQFIVQRIVKAFACDYSLVFLHARMDYSSTCIRGSNADKHERRHCANVSALLALSYK
jgi:hypothetical protein